jgi:hypothetical protein
VREDSAAAATAAQELRSETDHKQQLTIIG